MGRQEPQAHARPERPPGPGTDAAWMRRALALAGRGRFTASPNPLVGCVLVRDGVLVGEGWHERAGAAHAEAVALAAAGERARGATAYCTLEPCRHHGRTAPCTEALIAARVARVVAATADPHPDAGGGTEELRRAGIAVELGCGEAEARQQNEVFFHGVASRRPFVIAKAAISLDGRIAAADGSSQWLTGPEARARSHALRAEVDAVVVGSGTFLADRPRLTVRLAGYEGPQPLRVVLDRRGRVRPPDADDGGGAWLVHRDGLDELLRRLWDAQARAVLVEGGATLLGALASMGLIDKWVLHLAGVLLGERGLPLVTWRGPETLADARRLRLVAAEELGGDAVLTAYPEKES